MEATGATEKLTTTLMKLYQEVERPQNAIGFIQKQLHDGSAEEAEEVKALKDEIKKLKAELEKTELELKFFKSEQAEVKETPSEAELLLSTKFKAMEADETGGSLLKEYLTEEVFEKLKNLTTELGGTLMDNIQSGLTHFDSEIGIFASDQHAYDTFALLFEPVLEDVHSLEVEGDGDDAPQVEQPEVDWGSSEELIDLDPEGLFITSVSVTVGRALDGVHFMPTITLEKLQETAGKIREVLTGITDEELAGKYHELVEIDEEQKAKWIEDGTLFRAPDDKFLTAAETFRFWPLARGLFVNDKNNFRAWVNEEEHLQVTTFDAGGNLQAVYQRLVKVMEAFAGLEFARHKRFGFVAHNLKNIGNTMRIAVKAKIPQLSLPENAEKLEASTDGNHVTVKDLGNGLMELSSSKRVGATEINTVTAFQKAIGEVLAAEKCLYA